MNFKVNVRNTGATRTVSGLNANESILTLAMEQTNQQNGQNPAIAFTNARGWAVMRCAWAG